MQQNKASCSVRLGVENPEACPAIIEFLKQQGLSVQGQYSDSKSEYYIEIQFGTNCLVERLRENYDELQAMVRMVYRLATVHQLCGVYGYPPVGRPTSDEFLLASFSWLESAMAKNINTPMLLSRDKDLLRDFVLKYRRYRFYIESENKEYRYEGDRY